MEIKGVEYKVPYSGINSLTTFLCGARFIETQLSSCGPISNIDTLACASTDVQGGRERGREREREKKESEQNALVRLVNDIYIYILPYRKYDTGPSAFCML